MVKFNPMAAKTLKYKSKQSPYTVSSCDTPTALRNKELNELKRKYNNDVKNIVSREYPIFKSLSDLELFSFDSYINSKELPNDTAERFLSDFKNKSWSLFIDDIRYPDDDICAVAGDCVVARSSNAAIAVTEILGVPKTLHLDYHLGCNAPTTEKYVDFLIGKFESDKEFSKHPFPDYYIHSQHEDKNIVRNKLRCFLRP